MAVNKGLGKGLSALFSDTDAEYEHSSAISENKKSIITETAKNISSAGKPLMIPVERIYPNPNQPRKNFEPASLNELAQSIKEHGIIQPIIVCNRGEKYMIIAGERRFRAAKLAGLMELPAFINEYTEKEIKEVSLIENLQREDLNPIEAADAIKQLMDEFSLTQDELARRIGKSRPAITNLLRLLNLPQEIIEYLKEKRLSEGQARCLIGMESVLAVNLAQLAAENNMSVREIEKAVKTVKNKKSDKTKTSDNYYEKQSRELKDLISQMQKVFGTKVSAVGSNTKGRIYIDYFTTEDLERIFEVIEKLK